MYFCCWVFRLRILKNKNKVKILLFIDSLSLSLSLWCFWSACLWVGMCILQHIFDVVNFIFVVCFLKKLYISNKSCNKCVLFCRFGLFMVAVFFLFWYIFVVFFLLMSCYVIMCCRHLFLLLNYYYYHFISFTHSFNTSVESCYNYHSISSSISLSLYVGNVLYGQFNAVCLRQKCANIAE